MGLRLNVEPVKGKSSIVIGVMYPNQNTPHSMQTLLLFLYVCVFFREVDEESCDSNQGNQSDCDVSINENNASQSASLAGE